MGKGEEGGGGESGWEGGGHMNRAHTHVGACMHKVSREVHE